MQQLSFGFLTMTDAPAQLVAVGLAGIVTWHLIRRRRANLRLVVQLAFFAALTLLMLSSELDPFRFQQVADGQSDLVPRVAKLLWWIHLAWALIGLVRIYLVLDGRQREARLLQDLVVGVVYIGMALSALAFVFGIPIGTLVATSGLVAIILGLALQNTLSDVFSGIALTLGRPFVINDWILLSDGTEGRVVESTWRSTNILTGANNLVVLPNSMLAKLGLTNVSRPDGGHQLSLVVRIAPTRMPAIVTEVMRSALMSATTILQQPQPIVALKGIDAVALEVELQFRVSAPALRTPARNEVLDLVYRHCKAAGLLLAQPATAHLSIGDLPTEETAKPPRIAPSGLIEAIAIFDGLTPDEKRSLAEAAVERTYRKGDAIAKQGEALASLMIMRAGVIALRRDGADCGRLAPGDIFGETGLLAGLGEAHMLEALTPVTVYEIGQASLAPLLARRPEMAEALAMNLSLRAESGKAADASASHRDRRMAEFLKAIREIFRT